MDQTIRVSGALLADVVFDQKGQPFASSAWKPSRHGTVYRNATTSYAAQLHRDLEAALPGADRAQVFEEGVTCLLKGELGPKARTAGRASSLIKLVGATLVFEAGVDIDRALVPEYMHHHTLSRAQYFDLDRCERSVLSMIACGVRERVAKHYGRATLNGNEAVWTRSAFYAVAAYPKFLCEEVRRLMPNLVAVAYPMPRLVDPPLVTFFPDRAQRLGRQVTVWAPALPARYAQLRFVTPAGTVMLPPTQLAA